MKENLKIFQDSLSNYNVSEIDSIFIVDKVESLLDVQKEHIVNKIKYWFENIGPFVFPEDEDTLNDLISYIKHDN